MFVYSIKGSTIRFALTMMASLAVLMTLIFVVPVYENQGSLETSADDTVRFDGIKTDEDRIEFLRSLGWEIKTDGALAEKVTIPSEFDSVFAGYNDIQKQQGLDLSRYKRKEVMHYRYEITNYKDHDGTVYVNLLVYRGRVIGGDICSASPGGFVKGLRGE